MSKREYAFAEGTYLGAFERQIEEHKQRFVRESNRRIRWDLMGWGEYPDDSWRSIFRGHTGAAREVPHE